MTYVPNRAYRNSPMDQAIEQAESLMEAVGAHTIYAGRNIVHGEDQGEALVFVVEDKGPRAQKHAIPAYILTPGGNSIPTDVVAGPPPRDLRLRLTPGELFRAQAGNPHQGCFDAPIPGGVQIAPAGAGWVGTLGAALKLPGGYGLLTNEHVSGQGNVGGKCCQPHGRSGWIGDFNATAGIRYDAPNYIDAATALCRRTDGPFAPATDLVAPVLYGIGPLNPAPAAPALGLKVRKSGRTTGVTSGRIIGLGATSRIRYDEGMAFFRDLIVIEAFGGLFSDSGDSGSLIVTDPGVNPVGLLFAGGGGQTLACRIDYVLDWCKGEFFAV